MKLDITHSYDIWKSLDPKSINDAWEKSKLADKKWISEESLLELSPKELLDEVRKLHIQKQKGELNNDKKHKINS